MIRSRTGLMPALLVLLSALSFHGSAKAQSCDLSVSDTGSELTLGEAAVISTRLDNPESGDTRTVGVLFTIIEGDADFDGDPGPLVVPVTLSGDPQVAADVDVNLVARAAGPIQVSVTWLDSPAPSAQLLTCGETVTPNGFDLLFLASGAEPALELEEVSGDDQDILEDEISEPLVVQVSSSDGSDTAGLLIEFDTDDGDVVQLLQSSVLTDADGTAEITVLGLSEGDAVITASLSDDPDGSVDPVIFLVSVSADSESEGLNMSLVSGDEQTLELNVFSEPLLVSVSDDDDSPLEDETVSWRVEPASAAVLEETSNTTDGAGKAQNRVRALVEGEFAVIAEVRDEDGIEADSVRFELIAEAAEPELMGSLSVVSGNNQTLAVNQFSEPLVVAAADQTGMALTGANLSWRVDPPAAAELERTSSLTDVAGKSQNRVKGLLGGRYQVIAELRDGDETVAMASFTMGSESIPTGATLTVISGNNQGLVPGQPSEPLVVELRNLQGQPLAGALLRFSATPVGAVLFDPTEALTDASGRASTRVAPQLPGGVTITVTVVGDPSITTSFALRGGTTFIPGLNPNQQGVAGAIDAACPQLAAGPPPAPGSAQADLLARCSEIVGAAGSRPAEVQNALNQLLPDEAAPQATASLNIRDSQLRNLDVRLDALRGGARGNSLAGLTLNTQSGVLPLDLFAQLASGVQGDVEDQTAGGLVSPWGMFLTGTIGRVERDSTNNNPGFDGDTLSLTGGLDYRFSNRLVAGIALGYDDNQIALVNDTGGIETRSLTLSLYGSYASDNDFYLDGRFAYGQLDFDLERNIRYTLGANPVNVTTQAAPEGNSRLLALSLGRNFNRNAWNFGGYLRGELSTIELDGYIETIRNADRDGRGLAVQIDSRELDSRTATLGARLGYTSSRDWGVLLPFARVEWVHEFEDAAQTVVARFVNDPSRTAISITGETQDDGYGNLALGLSSIFANGRSVFLQYERRIAQEAFERQSISLGGRFEF